MAETPKKRQTALEKAREDEKQARARRIALEQKIADEEKKNRQRVLYAWGEVIADAVAGGDITPQKLEEWCKKHLSGNRQKMAVSGIETVPKKKVKKATAKKTDATGKDTPVEPDQKSGSAFFNRNKS